jgi:hypothetical protein
MPSENEIKDFFTQKLDVSHSDLPRYFNALLEQYPSLEKIKKSAAGKALIKQLLLLLSNPADKQHFQFKRIFRVIFEHLDPKNCDLAFQIFIEAHFFKVIENVSDIFCIKFPDNITTWLILQFISSPTLSSSMQQFLCSNLEYIQYAEELLQSNHPDIWKENFTLDLLNKSITLKNALLIQRLQKLPYFNKALETLNETELATLNQLRNQKYPRYYSARVLSTTAGLGRRKYTDALVSALEKKERKAYPYNPTILQTKEFHEYLLCLDEAIQAKTISPPLKEKFMVCGEHWIAGEIYIDSDNQVKILLLDSLSHGLEIINIDGTYFWDLAQAIHEVFANESYTIYIPEERRQNSPKGCSVIAENDLHYLFTFDNFSPEDLFTYLEKNAICLFEEPEEYSESESEAEYSNDSEDDAEDESTYINSIKEHIYSCALPLKFMRLTQSRKLLQSEDGEPSIIHSRDEEEQNRPFNKKKMTPLSAAREGVDFHQKNGKLANTRIEDVLLTKLSQRTDSFLQKKLQTLSLEELKQQLSTVALSSFKERIAAKSASAPALLLQYSKKRSADAAFGKKPEAKRTHPADAVSQDSGGYKPK